MKIESSQDWQHVYRFGLALLDGEGKTIAIQGPTKDVRASTLVGLSECRWEGRDLILVRAMRCKGPSLFETLTLDMVRTLQIVLFGRDNEPTRTFEIGHDGIHNRGFLFMNTIEDGVALEAVALRYAHVHEKTSTDPSVIEEMREALATEARNRNLKLVGRGEPSTRDMVDAYRASFDRIGEMIGWQRSEQTLEHAIERLTTDLLGLPPEHRAMLGPNGIRARLAECIAQLKAMRGLSAELDGMTPDDPSGFIARVRKIVHRA